MVDVMNNPNRNRIVFDNAESLARFVAAFLRTDCLDKFRVEQDGEMFYLTFD